MKHITLTRRYAATVDEDDFDWLNNYHWHLAMNKGVRYPARTYLYTTYCMGIEVLKHYNLYDYGLDVKYHDGNGLNVQKSNLSSVKRVRQCQGEFRGVFQHGDKWKAIIRLRKIKVIIGIYDTKLEAAIAFNNMAREAFGDLAVLNLIDECY